MCGQGLWSGWHVEAQGDDQFEDGAAEAIAFGAGADGRALGEAGLERETDVAPAFAPAFLGEEDGPAAEVVLGEGVWTGQRRQFAVVRPQTEFSHGRDDSVCIEITQSFCDG